MRPRFALAPVFRVRALAAEREQARLAQIDGEIARFAGQIASIDGEIERTGAIRAQGLEGAMRAMHLRTSYDCVSELRGVREQMERQMRDLTASRETQVQRCVAAEREREVVKSLHEAHRAAWQAANDKQAQKQMDEMFLRKFVQRPAPGE